MSSKDAKAVVLRFDTPRPLIDVTHHLHKATMLHLADPNALVQWSKSDGLMHVQVVNRPRTVTYRRSLYPRLHFHLLQTGDVLNEMNWIVNLSAWSQLFVDGDTDPVWLQLGPVLSVTRRYGSDCVWTPLPSGISRTYFQFPRAPDLVLDTTAITRCASLSVGVGARLIQVFNKLALYSDSDMTLQLRRSSAEMRTASSTEPRGYVVQYESLGDTSSSPTQKSSIELQKERSQHIHSANIDCIEPACISFPVRPLREWIVVMAQCTRMEFAFTTGSAALFVHYYQNDARIASIICVPVQG